MELEISHTQLHLIRYFTYIVQVLVLYMLHAV
ncbi:MAG: hypothetical protein ACI8RD_011353, partial [Bacillariaceae sp.]